MTDDNNMDANGNGCIRKWKGKIDEFDVLTLNCVEKGGSQAKTLTFQKFTPKVGEEGMYVFHFNLLSCLALSLTHSPKTAHSIAIPATA